MSEPEPARVALMARGLTMRFGGLTAVSALDLVAETGQVTSLIGPNGAGKTTAFNCITGFYKPTVGEIVVQDGDQTRRGASIRCRAIGWSPMRRSCGPSRTRGSLPA